MSKEIFNALELLEKEKGIPKDYMLEKISQALLTAYKRDHDGAAENVVIEPDMAKRELRMYAQKTVVGMWKIRKRKSRWLTRTIMRAPRTSAIL